MSEMRVAVIDVGSNTARLLVADVGETLQPVCEERTYLGLAADLLRRGSVSPAKLDDAATAPLGPLTWVRWRTQAVVGKAGSARLRVRATDGSGQVQDGLETEPLPSGATGWHRVTVRGVPPTS